MVLCGSNSGGETQGIARKAGGASSSVYCSSCFEHVMHHPLLGSSLPYRARLQIQNRPLDLEPNPDTHPTRPLLHDQQLLHEHSPSKKNGQNLTLAWCRLPFHQLCLDKKEWSASLWFLTLEELHKPFTRLGNHDFRRFRLHPNVPIRRMDQVQISGTA